VSRLSRSAAIVTVLSVAGQLVGLVTQVVIAGIFGARADMDAFLAASTLPQYVVAVLLGALSAVFVPVFLEYQASGRPSEAWRVASAVVTLTAVFLGALGVGGLLLAEPLLRLTTPGLTPESLALAATIARVTWPMIAASGLVGLVTGICHANNRFTWPAVVPALGALLNLALVVILAPRWGVLGVAVAGTVSVFTQAAFLLRHVAGRDRLGLSFDWRHPGLLRVVSLLWPLVLSAILVRYTPIVDRYVASGMPEGAIAHLGYAFRLVTFLALFLSSGIAAVVFPRMAFDMAARDVDGMRRTVSLAMRVMWLGVAPVVATGIVLGYPFIAVLLERGAFRAPDTSDVAALWQIYLLSLVGGCLGTVTGRAFFAMQATRLLAVMGVIEAVGYVAYTPLLASHFGVGGVAAAYVLYFSLSIAWQIPVLLVKLGRQGGGELSSSMARTAAAAAVAGVGAYAVVSFQAAPWPQLIGGGMIASALYVLCLRLWGGPEVQWTTQALKGMAASKHS
jgi:putative peptidoglycan lipid II flippase